MDELAGLLDGPRARQAFLLRSVLDPPWSFRIEDRAPLSITAVVRGSAWIVPDDGSPFRLAAGDTAILRGPDAYVVADDPATLPTVAVGPDQRCRPMRSDGRPLVDSFGSWTRTWGNTTSGATVLLTGTYRLRGGVSARLLRTLPAQLHLDRAEGEMALIELLGDEIARDRPGQQAVLDRLLDLLLIATLRGWFARPDGGAPNWYRASGDPVVGPVLRLLHHRPADAWTVASLAAEIGVSRTVLARRFTELVGEPPMTFLTGCRMALAADLLLEPDATVGSVARQVGYATPFALSAAFKRTRGVSPQEHRAGVRPAGPVVERQTAQRG